MTTVIPRDSRITEGITERGSWRMWNCDVLEALRCEPDDWFHCIAFSPPYWKKRNYGCPGEMGQEDTLQQHIDALVEVCKELRRVLRPDGVMFINYQDGYSLTSKQATQEELIADQVRAIEKKYPTDAFSGKSAWGRSGDTSKGSGLKPKQMLLIPARLSLALQADNWWMRSRITWHKPNARPDSCDDRPSQYDEDILVLTKSPRNFWDKYVVRENRPGDNWGRQLGNVWSINTEPCPYPHASTWPREIPRRIISLTTSDRIDRNGKALMPIYEPIFNAAYSKACGGSADGTYSGKSIKDYAKLGAQSPAEIKANTLRSMMPHRAVGFTGEAYPGQCRVLDPFAGVGTTLLEGLKLGRSCTGIDASKESYDIACQRLRAFEQGFTYEDLAHEQLSLLEDAWT